MTRRTLLALLLLALVAPADAAPKPKYLFWRYHAWTGNTTLYLLRDWRTVKRDGNTIWAEYTYEGYGRWNGGNQSRFPPNMGAVVGETNELPEWARGYE